MKIKFIAPILVLGLALTIVSCGSRKGRGCPSVNGEKDVSTRFEKNR